MPLNEELFIIQLHMVRSASQMCQEIINKIPAYVFIKDEKSRFLVCNQRALHLFGVHDNKSLVGRTDFDLPYTIEGAASLFVAGDQSVFKNREEVQFVELVELSKGKGVPMLTTKSPLFDGDGNLVGLTGCGVDLKLPSLIEFFQNNPNQQIITSGSNTASLKVVSNYPQHSLSPAEELCLFYLIRGKTCRAIAKEISRSVRTIETHLESIKVKLSCHSKAELIERCINEGYLTLIPRIVLNQVACVKSWS